jgi:hypothetical protein
MKLFGKLEVYCVESLVNDGIGWDWMYEMGGMGLVGWDRTGWDEME